MYVAAEPRLEIGSLVGRPTSKLGDLIAPWKPEQFVPFASGQAAFWGALKALHLEPGDAVLVPSYLFHAVLAPLTMLGLTCEFYPVSPTLDVDPRDVAKHFSERTKAVLLVHYFGFPGPAQALRQLCDERDVPLIEDCAHALFGSVDGRPLGSIGHLSIFSLKKPLSVPGGGALVINSPKWRFEESLQSPAIGETSRLVALRSLILIDMTVGWSLKTRLLASHNFRRMLARRTKRPASNYAYRLSRLSEYIGRRVDRADVVRRRRANYDLLFNELVDLPGLQPVYPSLPPGVSPICFPVFADNRDDVQDWLLRQGVHARVYWDVAELPKGVVARFPELRAVLDRILILPVHQNLSARHMEYVVQTMRSVPGGLAVPARQSA